GRVRVPSSPIDVLTHHREHVTSTAPIASPDDLPALADALRTQDTHARHLVAAGGHYLFIVKANQPPLQRRLKALPWRQALLNHRSDERAHSRREIRRMKICTVRPDLPFPHAAQALQVKRRRPGHGRLPQPGHRPGPPDRPSAWPA
ncbi:hypothetical protein ACFFRU_13695, partial [Planobispora longispora]